MPAISNVACHTYYRLTTGGAELPHEGPVLIVANHSNSLMDPALVVVAAHRTVRFMAKSPLFKHPIVGWLVRAVGSVPVYRRIDDPKLVSQNFDSLRDVHRAIADGYAVGIFPEGISHSAARLQPLKTGAARIALGAAALRGGAFPIVPMGMVFRDRRTFRSSARVIVGQSAEWDDLALRGTEDKEAVRELTRRIDASMRTVTLNLRSWADEQIIRCAERIWAAEFGASSDLGDEMVRLQTATDALARLRLDADSDWRSFARELRAHDKLLSRLGLTPASLKDGVSSETAIWWALRRLPLLLLLLPVAAVGLLLFWLPREITGYFGTKLGLLEGEDAVPTYRVLLGAIVFTFWFFLLAVLSSFALGFWGGLVVFLSLPLIGFGAIAVGETRRMSWVAARRFFAQRFERDRVTALRRRQAELAERLRALVDAPSLLTV